MTHSRHWRLLGAGLALAITSSAKSQQPFDLDPSFRAQIDTWYVASILPMDDGDIWVSGQMKFPGDLTFRSGARLNSDGTRDVGVSFSPMGGKLVQWFDKIYSISGDIVRRLLLNGAVDNAFIGMNLGPYFSSGQGGDYHVFPDGRVLMSGVHQLSDVQRGYVGYYCLCWFTEQGFLDTTRVHRTCSGSLDRFQALPDGKFIGSGSTASYDGQPASNIFRFNADGSLDPSFQANVTWGSAFGFLPLEDGRVYAAGQFTVMGVPDTLRLVRFMPDGSLDPTFNHTLDFQLGELSGAHGGIAGHIHQLDASTLIVTGSYRSVDGQVRKGICAVDTVGNLLDQPFEDCGAGTFQYQGLVQGGLRGFIPAPDGSFYVWGDYHGYDDGTTNDTTQRMVSRLYGLDVGVREQEQSGAQFRLHPNPASAWVAMEYELSTPPRNASLRLLDITGRTVRYAQLNRSMDHVHWDLTPLQGGVYSVQLFNDGGRMIGEQLIVQP